MSPAGMTKSFTLGASAGNPVLIRKSIAPVNTLITFVSTILFLLVLCGLIYHVYAIFCILDFFSREPARPRTALEPVSIIKPLSGIDPGLDDNLKSFSQQDYPEYEVLLGFSERDARASAKVSRDILPFLGDNARIVVSDRELGSNRKVSNLQGMLDAARYPFLAISDSDMRAGPDYLRTVAHEFLREKN